MRCMRTILTALVASFFFSLFTYLHLRIMTSANTDFLVHKKGQVAGMH